ncbi:MAG TPA: hypothetical protein VEU32_17295 [Burkholderiales bacterium]|nr:hypothetical protein [Burkholderiales bacterium]
MRTSRIVLVVSAVSLLAACAAQVPQPRKAIAKVPPLDPKVSRVVIAPGVLDRGGPQAATLATVRQVGPVYFDGKWVSDLEQNEYVVVDVKPGMHDVACSPLEPVKNYIEVRHVNFEPGETKSLVCDMATASGALGQKYSSKSYLEPRVIDPEQGTVVDYKKIP